jgi:hypothetical protein
LRPGTSALRDDRKQMDRIHSPTVTCRFKPYALILL